jgi:hypothetical protein
MDGFVAKPVAVDDIAAEMAMLCIHDLRPFALVEDPAFTKFVGVINPSVVLPSADTVAHDVVLIDEVLQEKVRREVLLRDLGHTSMEGAAVPPGSPFTLYSTTTDAWTNRADYPFAALTLHYLTDDFAMKSHVLAVRHFPAPHTAAAYEELLGGLLEENSLVEGNLLTCAMRQTAAPRKLVPVRVTR